MSSETRAVETVIDQESGVVMKPERVSVKLLIIAALLLAAAVAVKLNFPLNRGWKLTLVILSASSALSILLTPIMMHLSFRWGWLDIPAGRKAHGKATPLLGGAAVIIAFGLSLLLTFHYSIEMKGIGIGALLIWVVGVVDDKRELSARFKLLMQLLAVAILIATGVKISFLPNTWWGYSAEVIITMFWVVGITNAVNYLDGMDGLATGMSAIIAFFLALVAKQTDQLYFTFVSIALFGACVGFLPYNFKKNSSASIFLGDSGATFLGFTLAATTLLGDWADNRIGSLAVPLLLLGVPIFDMTLTTIMRIAGGQVRTLGEWLSYAGRDHFHHRLASLGIGRYLAVMFIWSTTALLGVSAVVMKDASWVDALLLLGQAGIIFAMISFFMIYVRSHQIGLFIKRAGDEERRAISIDDLDKQLNSADKNPAD